MATLVADTLELKNNPDRGVVEDVHLIGGYQTLPDIASRDAMPSQRRKEGMVVKVLSDGAEYTLVGGLANGDWAKVVTGGSATLEPITVVVDFASGDDVGYGNLMRTQAEADGLAPGGFKYLQQALDAFPEFVLHDANLNLTAETHFADPGNPNLFGDFAFTWRKRLAANIKVFINGDSSWTDVVAAVTIVSHVPGSPDPAVTVAGTPYTGLDLKGLYAVFDNGFSGLVHEHTTDTLRIAAPLSPTPVDSVTTVRVVRPATELRNALAASPTVTLNTSGCFAASGPGVGNFRGWLELNNLMITGMDSGRAFEQLGTDLDVVPNFVLVDKIFEEDDLAVPADGRGFQFTGRSTNCFGTSVSFRSRNGLAVDEPLFIGTDTVNVQFVQSYFGSSPDALLVQSGGILQLFNSVVDNVDAFRIVQNGSRATWASFFGGVNTTFRNCRSFGISFEESAFNANSFLPFTADFVDMGGGVPALNVTGGATVVLLAGTLGSSGNADVGFQKDGNQTLFESSSAVMAGLTGAVDDTRIDGVLRDWATVAGLSPLTNATRLSLVDVP